MQMIFLCSNMVMCFHDSCVLKAKYFRIIFTCVFVLFQCIFVHCVSSGILEANYVIESIRTRLVDIMIINVGAGNQTWVL